MSDPGWLWPLLPVALWFVVALQALRDGPEALARGRLLDLTLLALACGLLGWMLVDIEPASWTLAGAALFVAESFHPAALLGKLGLGGALYGLFVAGLYGARRRDPQRGRPRPTERPPGRR